MAKPNAIRPLPLDRLGHLGGGRQRLLAGLARFGSSQLQIKLDLEGLYGRLGV